VQGLPDLRAICTAPGKVILFGEHAVVYGHPALAAATDQRTHVEVDCCGTEFTVNGLRIHDRYHSYLLTAVKEVWGMQGRSEPIRIQTEGGVPSASGTGSSAALTVATVGAMHALLGKRDPTGIARDAFRVERLTQGGGSPTDTSTSTAGGGIAISRLDDPPGVGERLWDLHWDDPEAPESKRAWAVERIDLPDLTVVVGNSGIKGRTDEQVAKVAHAQKKNAVVRDALADIGRITRDAVPLLRRKDFVGIGALMDKAHAALHMLGVNHPAVENLVQVARATPGTLGAKLTGAGGGGSMFALTERPQAVAEAITAAGGTAYVVRLGGPGVQWPGNASGDALPAPSPAPAADEAAS
jgi:mevalonate kinase